MAKRFLWIVLVCMIGAHAANLDDTEQLSIMADIRELQKGAVKKYALQDLLKAADSNYSLQSKALATLQSKKDVMIQTLRGFIPSVNIKYKFNNNERTQSIYRNYNTQQGLGTFTFNLFNGYADINAIKEKNATYLSKLADEGYTRENIYLQVAQQYYGYFDNLVRLISLQKKFRQIQSDVARVDKLYTQGLSPIDDLESLKAQASQSEYQIANAKLAIEQNKLMLELLTNLKVEGLIFSKIRMPNFGLQDRLDIISLNEQINVLRYQNKQMHFYPVVDLDDTFTYNIEKPAFARGPLSYIYPTIQNSFGATVTMKVLDNVGLSIQKQSTRIAQLSNEKMLTYKKLEQKKDEELYRMTLEIAQKQIQSARDNLKSASIAFESKKKKYEANLITFTEYLQALSMKFDAESTFNQSINNFEFQKANYIFYSGQKIKNYIN
ncbi:TolC family protein [Helicobacter mustelae]|uniref:Putative outer membrane component of efflux system n=1 Tax=Helicobacter mustelae (strain ATCC 43772 / CCUG 25715 / CIP 103759 / LMG 18044 / NCTC 12198 / R85-136P) TaxID=679897 RepID=D3UGQ3_HELM1|nr:TolC family protein [Helicobacter mustelae]CBG39674.1 putative outer membrane component of efflux system [Helicobacter mustelae 12198]SQH71180.1 outer membrane component of efflux system [Helicobacter mustelae]